MAGADMSAELTTCRALFEALCYVLTSLICITTLWGRTTTAPFYR